MTRKKQARRDELARKHNLGKLELQRAVITLKRWIFITGAGMLSFYAFMAVIAILTTPHTANADTGGDSAVLIFVEIAVALLIICVPGFTYVYIVNDRTVALYTRGLVYLGVRRERVALWKDVSWVQKAPAMRGGSYRVIHLTDGTRLRLTNLPDRESAKLNTMEEFIQARRGF